MILTASGIITSILLVTGMIYVFKVRKASKQGINLPSKSKKDINIGNLRNIALKNS